MSTSGSRAQFGQLSLGPDFDHYANQMRFAGSQEYAQRAQGAGEGKTISVSVPPSDVRKITGTGEIRNGFGPGATLRSTARAYLDNRLQAEEHVFGVPGDADHTQRPIYGYLEHTNDPRPGPYGHAVFDIQPRRDRELTTLPGDSMDQFTEKREEYSGDPEWAGRSIDVEHLNEHHEPWPGGHWGYQEVQVHGGPIDLRREVSRAHLFRQHYNDDAVNQASSELKTARVPHAVYRHMEYQPTLDQETFGKGKEGWVNEEAYSPAGQSPGRRS